MTLLFQDKRYLSAQQYPRLISFQENDYEIHFSVTGDVAVSQPGSPFGGILMKSDVLKKEAILDAMKTTLRNHNIHHVVIHQAPHYYHEMMPESALIQAGFEIEYSEKNQYISLQKPINLHQMEKRILKRPNEFAIQREGFDKLKEIHSFLSSCRKSQGLEINTSYEKLEQLCFLFPDQYFLFTARKENTLCAVCIFCLPTPEVVYYYLPGTHPDFMDQSPMVHLMCESYSFFKSKGCTFMDLGLSSIKGELQDGLYRFKAHMGAETADRVTLVIDL